MHQDIKTFSEVLDIDTGNQLLVRLAIRVHGNINYRMRLNGHLISDLDTEYKLDLFSPINLKCSIFDPNDGALEIIKLLINGTEILPLYQHLAVPPTAWITEDWEFQIPSPFYPWFHAISGQGSIA